MENSTVILSRRRALAIAAQASVAAGAAVLGSPSAHASPLPSAPYPFEFNQVLLDDFAARRGGPIGTDGQVAVAFRCDHHLNRFKADLLSLHQKYSIPLTIAAMSQMAAVETGPNGSDLVPPYLLQKFALENGFEVANHSATHRDADTALRLREEIVYSQQALARSLPKLPIELFVPPGVGGTGYQGFNGGPTPASFQTYLAGRLITQQHAMSTGYVPGYWPMTGEPLMSMGKGHVVIDNAVIAQRGQGYVNDARRKGQGICFMYHPSAVDSTDLAAIEAFLAWCAAERDAGRLEILTVGGLMMARFGSNVRHDLLGARGFGAGWHGWNGSAGKWTIRAENGVYFARRGYLSTALTRDISVAVHAGSTRQLRIRMRSTSGTRVRLEVFDPESPARFQAAKVATLEKSAFFGPLHQYVTLPLMGTRVIRVRITPITGGELHVQEPQLLAA